MSSISGAAARGGHGASLGILTAGFLALYVPSYVGLAQGIWMSADDAHGPIMLAAAAWMLWKRRAELAATIGPHGHWIGWPILAAGLLSFVVGRALQVLVLEVLSQLLVLTGSVVLLGGHAALRRITAPVLLLLFVVPLPGNVVDALTGSMKQAVSAVAETMLHTAGYPIARSGVMIWIGQYQLLVADACSGLKSVFSLSATGVLYVLLVGHASAARNAVLVAASVLFAVLANLVRVITLILVTYHLGDEAGQGFAHDFAGVGLFVLAVLLLAGLDRLLDKVFGSRRASPAPVR